MTPTSHRSRVRRSGFTLIEVLVVVAIIALLISILLPSLKAAREQGKRAVCLSNEHQMGIGFSMYASEFRQYLPLRDSFTYYIKKTETIHGRKVNVPINYGPLYGKYVGKDLHIFYCPGNLLYVYEHEPYGAASFFDANIRLTFGGYMYGVPMNEGTYPRITSKSIYPEDCLDEKYISWREDWIASKGYDPLKRSPQVLLSDALIGDGYKAVHKGAGYNVLYSDFHAKWVSDPRKYILNMGISSGTGGFPGQCKAWDYFASRP